MAGRLGLFDGVKITIEVVDGQNVLVWEALTEGLVLGWDLYASEGFQSVQTNINDYLKDKERTILEVVEFKIGR